MLSNYGDFLEQIRTVRKLGPLSKIVGNVPFLAKFAKDIQEDALDRIEKILTTMTPVELKVPELFEGPRGDGRRASLAARAEVELEEVDQFVKNFASMQEVIAKHEKK